MSGTAASRRGLRGLQWLLILAALVLLVLLVRNVRQAGAPPEDDPWQPPLRGGQPSQVDGIDLMRDPRPLHLERRDGTWWLTTPIPDLASGRTVRELLRALAGLEIRRRLAADSLAAYGLDPPWAILTLRLAGDRQVTLQVGDTAPASGDVYATWTGLPGVALIPRFVVARFFQSELLSWRETEVLPPAAAGIDSVWIRWPDEQACLVRSGSERWAFRRPPGRQADGEICERVVASFWRFPFTRFFDGAYDAAALGLSPPQATWIVFRAGIGDTLRIGAHLDQASMVVQVNSRAPGRVRPTLYEILTGGLLELELRTFFQGAPREVTAVLARAGGDHRYFLRSGDGWLAGQLGRDALAKTRDGQRPDSSEVAWGPRPDATLDGDLRNLFWLSGDRWLPPESAPAAPGAFPLQIHLWDASGAHQWAAFRHPAGSEDDWWEGAVPDGSGERPGIGISGREPRRPLEVSSEVLLRWWLRARPRER